MIWSEEPPILELFRSHSALLEIAQLSSDKIGNLQLLRCQLVAADVSKTASISGIATHSDKALTFRVGLGKKWTFFV